jgi:predicted lipase
VHKGFNDSIESFFGKGIVKEIQSRLKSNRDSQLYITGHSKGGALAYLAALLLARRHREIPLAGVITFEAPRPGHPNFVEAYNSAGIDSLRYEFQNDIVPHVPPAGIFATSLTGLLKKSAALATALGFLYPKGCCFAYIQTCGEAPLH